MFKKIQALMERTESLETRMIKQEIQYNPLKEQQGSQGEKLEKLEIQTAQQSERLAQAQQQLDEMKKLRAQVAVLQAQVSKLEQLEAKIAELEAKGVKKEQKEKKKEEPKPVADQVQKKKAAEKAEPPVEVQKPLTEREKIIQSIMKKAGWTRQQTIEKVEAARKHIGINYTKFDKYDFHTIAEDQQAQAYLDILTNAKVKGKQARLQRKNEKLLMTVIVNTGWDYEDAKAAMAKAEKISGAEYKDYVAYRFWEMDDALQSTYFTKGDANALRKKYNTNKEHLRFFMNKNEFNEKFEKFLGRPWAYNAQMSFEDFQNAFASESRIIYKPLSDSCGHGVTVFDLTPETMQTVYDNLVQLPAGVVEGYVKQHPEMSKYSRNSVNTVRLVSVCAFGKVNVLYAAFRMGGGDAVVDNFHAGGVLALIDTTTGELETEAIDLAGKFYDKHPVTGEKILGFKIPYWKEAVAMIEEAGQVVEGVGYVGWDIAITENGPILIEGNTSPAPNVLQTPHARFHRGMKHVVAKYLD